MYDSERLLCIVKVLDLRRYLRDGYSVGLHERFGGEFAQLLRGKRSQLVMLKQDRAFRRCLREACKGP